MGVRIHELPGPQKNKKSQAARSAQHHMVSSRQVQRALNDLQMIYCDR